MNESFKQFIRDTPSSADKRDWKERLLKPETSSALRLDLMYVGGQSVVDIILGHVSDKNLDPQVIEAFHLQYPILSHDISFVGEVRKLAGDPDRLRGFFSGLKGKLFEVEYRNHLNDGHLPVGYVAELSAKANEPGVDILVKDSHGHIQEQLQVKAYEGLQGVREHIERYPEFNMVVIPSDQMDLANAAGLSNHVSDGAVTEETLNQTVHHAIDQSDAAVGIHFPLVGFGLLAGEVTYLMVRGKPVSFPRVIKRGTKMTVAAIAGQIAYLLTHSTWVGVPAAVTTRLLIDRYSRAGDFIAGLEQNRNWARRWRESSAPDPQNVSKIY